MQHLHFSIIFVCMVHKITLCQYFNGILYQYFNGILCMLIDFYTHSTIYHCYFAYPAIFYCYVTNSIEYCYIDRIMLSNEFLYVFYFLYFGGVPIPLRDRILGDAIKLFFLQTIQFKILQKRENILNDFLLFSFCL